MDFGLVLAYGVIITLVLEWSYRIPYSNLKKNEKIIDEKVEKDIISGAALLSLASSKEQTKLINKILSYSKIRDIHRKGISLFKRESMFSSAFALIFALVYSLNLSFLFGYNTIFLIISIFALLFLIFVSSKLIYENDRDINKYLAGEDPTTFLDIEIRVI